MTRIGGGLAGVLAIALASNSAQALETLSVAECFDGIVDQVQQTDTDNLGLVAFHCSEGCCEPSCGCEPACGCPPGCSISCGTGGCGTGGCGMGCCGGVASCGGCCLENCGLLGQGILTYDPCACGSDLPELLLGSIACPSEGCFDDFISPMTNPIYFEDPRNVTELRGIFWQHKVPQTAGGGDINLYAMQIRARLSDRLSLIATKDGYLTSTNPLIDDGWADIALGVKYGLYRNVAKQQLLSAGVVYDAPLGTPRSLQGRGDGLFHLFLSGGAEIMDCGHWVSGFGGLIPVDAGDTSHFMYWSNHFDYQFRKGWYGLMEFNWFHWTDGGDNALGLTGIEGFDAFHLGSGGVGGQDIVTGAFGLKYKPNRRTEVGVAWENPLTARRDVIENRLTVDLILRY